MKIKNLWILVLGLIPGPTHLVCGQNRIPSKQLDSLFLNPQGIRTKEVVFDWVSPLDFPWTRTFRLCTSESGDSLLLQISNSSQLLLARKSGIGLVYLNLEKKGVFPFCQLEANTRYRILLLGSTFPHGYLIARLLHPDGRVLDEVFYCFSMPPGNVNFCDNASK